MSIFRFCGSAALLLFGVCSAFAQNAPQGIPIDDPLTLRKCGGCHQRDANGMMRRLSYIRTSPEVWEQAIKRMIRLNGLSATPAEVRDILKYLSNNNGLAPEEMKPAFWEVEHRTWGYQDDYVPSAAIQKTCNTCHNIGRVLAQRRTRDDYEKLVAMHLGLFPSAMNVLKSARQKSVPVEQIAAQMSSNANGGVIFEAPRVPTAAPPAKFPYEIALDYLASAQPLITPEWTAWRAVMKAPKLAGTWVLSGDQPGKGKIYGRMVVSPGAADDQFTTAVEFTYALTGSAVKTTGRGITYTGYNWRGRSGSAQPPSTTASAVPTEWREAMMVSRDGNSMDGRFFWSGFGELGIDVHLTRLGTEPVVLGTDVSALQSPSKATVKIYGANLPMALKSTDIDLGKGITVTKVLSATPSMTAVEVEVGKGLPVGMRDLALGKATAIDALAVYDKIGYIEIGPDAQISRLGGIKYPKGYAQYEVTAWAAGPDGKLHTDDDLALGPISAHWALEEFFSTPEDDDAKYVGAVDDSGLFTPNVEGPNPERKKQANNFGVNNYGDVWVAATYQAPDGKQFKARSYLVVTVPNYSIYDQPEVSQ